MKLQQLPVQALLAAAFLWCVTWAQPVQAGQAQNSSADPPASKSRTTPKEKHWAGSLVDAGCMAKALGAATAPATPAASPESGVPHFMGPAGQMQGAQAPAGGGGAGTNVTPGGRDVNAPPTGYPTDTATNPQEQARIAQENRVDNAAKQCAATPATQSFELALGNGQVMQFDPDGNSKASESLKQASVEPGKKVKAKVEGTLENSTTVKVASVDIKGNGKHPAKH